MKKNYKPNMGSIFDLKRDEDGVLRMDFRTMDYGDDGHIERQCCICKETFPQQELKELGISRMEGQEDLPDPTYEPIYEDKNKWYPRSFFICEPCHATDKISDASGWVA